MALFGQPTVLDTQSSNLLSSITMIMGQALRRRNDRSVLIPANSRALQTTREPTMNFLVFQHLDSEHPGVFRDFWREDGISWTTIALDEGDTVPDDLTQYDALAVMGGPMDTWQTDIHPWLVQEIKAIRHFVLTLQKPYLGICLGHQLLACALGGRVGPAALPEVGLCQVDATDAGKKDPFFKNINFPLETLQWHGAEVQSLPSDATILASSPLCANQSFRWGNQAYGIQFHTEINEEMLEAWSKIPQYAASLEQILGKQGAENLARDTRAALPRLRQTAQHLHRNFMTNLR